MDFTRAVTFVFSERDWWKKILITGLIGVIPFVGVIYLMGWMMEVVDRVKGNAAEKLPVRPTFAIFKNGVKLLAGVLIYLIPMMVLFSVFGVFKYFWQVIFDGFLENAGVQMFNLIVNIAEFIYVFLILFVLPGIIYKLIRRNSLRDTFDFKGVFQAVRNNSQTYFQLLVAAVICLIVAGVGISLLYVGVIFTMPLGLAIYSYVVGDAGKFQLV